MVPGTETVILVVEDDANIRTGLEAGLMLRSHRVATAANGREALAWLDQHRPHLIVLDFVMPDIDGPALIAEVRHRRLHPDVPILALSGEVDGAEWAARLGVAAFLPKPVSLATVLAAVTQLLSG
jgi:DNA-binding NtrC family response regulator